MTSQSQFIVTVDGLDPEQVQSADESALESEIENTLGESFGTQDLAVNVKESEPSGLLVRRLMDPGMLEPALTMAIAPYKNEPDFEIQRAEQQRLQKKDRSVGIMQNQSQAILDFTVGVPPETSDRTYRMTIRPAESGSPRLNVELMACTDEDKHILRSNELEEPVTYIELGNELNRGFVAAQTAELRNNMPEGLSEERIEKYLNVDNDPEKPSDTAVPSPAIDY